MLEISHLNKSFKKKLVLDNVNLKIEDNEIFGFVGPNGAGKTTTMRIIAGLLVPDGGKVILDGIDAVTQAHKLKRSIGYMPDFFGAYPNLTTREYMEYFTALYGVEGNEIKRRCDELLELVRLDDKKDVMVDTMSRGMKQRLCMARCLIHDPKLLILDEPASGLDPRARYDMKEIMKTLKEMGKTVIISSHILPELVEMTTTIGIIENGHIVTKGTIDDIVAANKKAVRVSITLVGGMEEALKVMKKNDMVSSISIMNNVYTFDYSGQEKELALLIKEIVEVGGLVSQVNKKENNLEEIFMEITKED